MEARMYAVKTRELGKTQWLFIGTGGSCTRLRIHAKLFTDRARADALAADINEENAGEWEAKTVEF